MDDIDFRFVGQISDGYHIVDDFERSIATTKAEILEASENTDPEAVHDRTARLQEIVENLREGVLVFLPQFEQLLAKAQTLAAKAGTDEEHAGWQNSIDQIEALIKRFMDCSRG